mgnify:CR=1 FL=1
MTFVFFLVCSLSYTAQGERHGILDGSSLTPIDEIDMQLNWFGHEYEKT